MKKATHSEEQSRPRKADDSTRPPTKIGRILRHLMTGASLNRYEAERIGDHCLNSTISELANHYGLFIHRRRERVPNRFDTLTDVIRYSLPASQRDRAAAVLCHLMRAKPGKEG